MLKHSYEDAHAWAQTIVSQMTLEEKCQYVGGTDAFFTKAIKRLGIPSVLFSDATAGVVLRDRFLETTFQNPLEKSTAFPAPIMLAATWNTELAEAFATAIGEQCRANGIGVLLGPGFNLYRVSQCGRNFEYFGEDPYLISHLVTHYVKGVQSTGTIATLKHFVANNTDYFRRKSNSIVDDRAMHEIYTRGFKAGIDAGALAVMTAYNLVNGEWASQSQNVIQHWLRTVLNFKWLVMTDWWAVYDCEKLATSGQDLEMPATDITAPLAAKIQAGEIAEAHVERMVTSILTTFKAMGTFEQKPSSITTQDFQRHESVALQTAREGMVLLKNRDNILPLATETPLLALGDGMVQKACGGGSAYVKGYDNVLQIDALKGAFPNIEYNAHPSDQDIQNAPCVLLSINTPDRESHDRPFALDRGEERYIRRIVALNKNVIVLMNAGGGVRMTDWIDDVAAVVYCFYNGQNGNVALAEILNGTTNPSGKLPITIEREFSDSCGANYIPEGEALYVGDNEAWEAAREVYDVHYDEGVFVGYRWYEHKIIAPLFPFGFGLSYTTFAYSALHCPGTFTGDSMDVSVTVTNTGDRAGREVVQLYIQNAKAPEPRPIKELKGFKKVSLEPGESQTVTLTLKVEDFAYWSDAQSGWVTPPGQYGILVGASSEAIYLSGQIILN